MIRSSARDSENEVVLGMPARQSSESARLESGCGDPKQYVTSI
jgi:hypothetical protein